MKFALPPSVAIRTGLLLTACLIGCQAAAPPPPVASAEPSPRQERLRPFVPATRPADPVTEALPTAPQDARRAVPLRYTVEIWEILMPRDSVSVDESFWKRVDEPATPEGQQLLKNGMRVGELPLNDLETIRKFIEDRGGKRTTYNGVAGRQVEIPVRSDVPDQVVFYHDRRDELVGRSWDRCDNFFYFSFETTPRNPERVRIALTPGVRAKERKLQYAIAPGRPDRELSYVSEQSQYDVTVAADLALDRMLIVAPSIQARQPNTLGGTFLVEAQPSQQAERLIMIIPHAFTREETPGVP
ncbi:MAG TPA: hypothetical protein VF595_04835 [Tepidisphaeraceae bacterium]|jgi:hypothetical protein